MSDDKGDLYELAGFLSAAIPELADVDSAVIVAAVDEYVAKLEIDETCEWMQDPDVDSDLWGTACGNVIGMGSGGPRSQAFEFCCYCGRPIVEAGEAPAPVTNARAH